MTNQNPEQTPDQNPDQDPTPAPSSRPAVRQTASSGDADRFAAYDTRLQKFVGGVHDTKKAATDAAKTRGVKAGDIDVRKV